MPETMLPIITGQGFASRIAASLPAGWAGADALQTGVWSSLLEALGEEFSDVLETLQYVLAATRLTTETSPELDLASLDFFGGSFPRPPGQTDAAFAQAIIANLFKSAVCRPAIAAALQSLTGFPPRMLEPWNIFDTGVWGRTSYWNVDTAANPARWGSPGSRYQGFIETAPHQIPALGASVPIYCWGSGPLGPYWNVPGYFFGIIDALPGQPIYDLVNSMRAEGTTVWVKIVNPTQLGTFVAPTAPTGVLAAAAGPTSLQVSWTASAVGAVPITYSVNYRVTGAPIFQNGPTVTQGLSALLTGLQPATQYDVQVQARNQGGFAFSAIANGTTTKIAPTPVTGLQATLVQATAVTLLWNAPTVGTPPFAYTVQYRVTTPGNNGVFSTFPVSAGAVGVTVIGLQPSTEYDFEVVASTT